MNRCCDAARNLIYTLLRHDGLVLWGMEFCKGGLQSTKGVPELVNSGKIAE